MPMFVFSYRVPTDYVPGGPETVAAWSAWFDTMRDNLSDRGNPVFEATAIGNCGEGTRLGGYSFIDAGDLESAVALAKGAPALQVGGGVDVGAVTVLDLDSTASQG